MILDLTILKMTKSDRSHISKKAQITLREQYIKVLQGTYQKIETKVCKSRMNIKHKSITKNGSYQVTKIFVASLANNLRSGFHQPIKNIFMVMKKINKLELKSDE